ncbi:MAG: PDZ domain-containing protein [Planctomycetes bacterium]|nr:PDZ domain-containing protein [Planctomycetota bacterium]
MRNTTRHGQGFGRAALRTGLLACVLAATAPAGAGEASGDRPAAAAASPEVRAKALVEQLGDPRFGPRSQAYDELLRMGRAPEGRAVLEPLTVALNHADPEVRTRAAEILIELRGRGFIGIQLNEDWGGEQVADYTEIDEENGQLAPPVPAEEPKPGAPRPFLPAPIVQVATVVRGQNLPGEKAGIQDGDKILAVNGRPTRGMYDLMREVIFAGPGTRIPVQIERGGKKQLVTVDLARNPEDATPPIDLRQPESLPVPAAKTEPDVQPNDGNK